MDKLKNLAEALMSIWPVMVICFACLFLVLACDYDERKKKREHKKIIEKNMRDNVTKS